MAGIELIACLPYFGILRSVVTRRRPSGVNGGVADARWRLTRGRGRHLSGCRSTRPGAALPFGSMPSILVAPDSFKGTFSAVEVAEAIGRGIERAGLEVDRCPVADGGEGTLEVVLAALGGRLVDVGVHDPLGRELVASFALLGEG